MARAYIGYYCPAEDLGDEADGISGSDRWDIDNYSGNINALLSNLQNGDIVMWGATAGEHAAYFSNNAPAPEYRTVHNTKVDHKEQSSSTAVEDISIHDASATHYGYPSHIARKKPAWKFKVQNDLDGDDSGPIKVDGYDYQSPELIENVHWGSGHTLVASMDGEEYPTYRAEFINWQKDGDYIGSETSKAINATPSQPTSYNTYTATFYEEYDVTFQNYFKYFGNAGVIEVDDDPDTAPITVQVAKNGNIDAAAVNQTLNSIMYTFDHWEEGSEIKSWPKSHTFYPTGHTTYTAHFNGKPTQVQGISCTSSPGELIHITWNTHPNSSVKYRIYRDIAHDEEDPTLEATLNHSVTAWTDQDYEVAGRPPWSLLNYDVRGYYTTEQTEATPNFGSVAKYARLAFKRITQALTSTPEQYNLSPAHPNPFNPSTTIAYDLPEASVVSLVIYDIRGREVMQWQRFEEPGSWELVWDSKDMNGLTVPTGVYIYRFIAVGQESDERFVASNKMVLMK